MPRITSLTSAPTASHRVARPLTKLSLVARKAFEAYLMSSADDGVVITTWAPVLPNSRATLLAAPASSLPMMTRSGCWQSRTAVPSRRNSGLDTTGTSFRPSARCTARTDPMGTVDLLITIAPALIRGPISPATPQDIGHVGGSISTLGRGEAQEDE